MGKSELVVVRGQEAPAVVLREFPRLKRIFQERHPCIYHVWTLLDPGHTSIWVTLRWKGKELALLTNSSSGLDSDSITTAYTTGMDTNYLHHASVSITELTLTTARKCFRAIRSANIAHWGENEDAHIRPMWSVHPCIWSGAIISLMDAASQDSSPASPSIAQEQEDMYRSIWLYNLHVSSALSHTRLVSVDFARIISHYNQHELPPDTINVAEKICNIDMGALANETSHICLGNDFRQQGECTTIQLACSVD